MKHILPSTLVFVLASLPATAQTTFTNDVSIKGGGTEDQLCVGDNCADDEVYAQNKVKIRIKDEDTALEFFDVSVEDRNWIIETNPGGTDLFQIGDQLTGNKPLVIRGSAPSSSLHVDGDGRVGVGTSTPTVDFHVVDGDTASLRLEQDGSGGFTPRAWEIAGNEQGFFIADRNTNGLPFKIRPGALTDTLVIGSNGNIGSRAGTFPDAPLHVQRAFGTASDMLLLENDGGVVFRLKDTSAGGQEFTFQSNGGIFRIASPAVPGPEFTMDDFGNVTIKGEITTAGSCSTGCDRVFDTTYDLPEMKAHHTSMWELGHLPNVGPTAEDGPMNLSEKVGGILNELEHAHIYIDQLNTHIARQDAVIAALIDRVDALEAE